MKIPISDFSVINLESPVLPAYKVVVNGSTYWVV
jgi:hypothetical protein